MDLSGFIFIFYANDLFYVRTIFFLRRVILFFSMRAIGIGIRGRTGLARTDVAVKDGFIWILFFSIRTIFFFLFFNTMRAIGMTVPTHEGWRWWSYGLCYESVVG